MDNCRICKTELTDKNWMPSLKRKNSKICKDCNYKKSKEWRKKNKLRSNEYSLKYYKKDPKKHIAACIKSAKKLRYDVVTAYGGKCCNCGISDFDVLDIDHIKNNGAIHRKAGMNSKPLYYFLKKNNYPKDEYQLLCRNCNWKKEIERKRKCTVSNF